MMAGASGTCASPITVSAPNPSHAASRAAASARSGRPAPIFCPTTVAIATDSPSIGVNQKNSSRVPTP